MCGESGKFAEAVFSWLPATAQHYRSAEIRDKKGKGLSRAELGCFIHAHHDSESDPASVGGRKLGVKRRGRLVGAARRVAHWAAWQRCAVEES